MKCLSFIALFFLVVNANPSLAQDTLQQYNLPGVLKTTLAAEKETLSTRDVNYAKTLTADSAMLATYRSQNVATLLSQQYPVFVRTYGTNGLATLSLRGASAAQTAVRWNGVPLQSGATGLVDLMLVPVTIMDEVSIQYGSNGGNAGSGAIGGTLYLNSYTPQFEKKHSASLNIAAGSFGRMIGALKFSKSSKKWSANIAAIGQQAENNFYYTDKDGQQLKMTNGHFLSGSLQAGFAYKLSPKDVLEAHIWADKNKREIPPALFEQQSIKEQKDAAIRSSLSFNHVLKGKHQYSINLSFFDEWFRYTDSLSAIKSQLHTRQWFAEPKLELNLSQSAHTQLIISLPQQLNEVVAEPEKHILKSGAVATLRYHHPKNFSLFLDARGESVNGKIFGAGGVNASTFLLRSLEVRGSAGYAYRTPTLNELYYTPGGNPDLLPEKGYSTEAGYRWSPKPYRRIRFTHSSTAFYRNINNWILWFGGAIWTPHNIARVVSSGLETENKLTWKRPKIQWQLVVNASFINSKTTESLIANDASIGKQIPYAPHVIANGNFGFTTRRWRLNYNQTYMGVRYYNMDETGELQAFTLGNVQAGYQYRHASWLFDLSLQLQNIWNKKYVEVSGRPAPGTNFLLSLGITESK